MSFIDKNFPLIQQKQGLIITHLWCFFPFCAVLIIIKNCQVARKIKTEKDN